MLPSVWFQLDSLLSLGAFLSGHTGSGILCTRPTLLAHALTKHPDAQGAVWFVAELSLVEELVTDFLVHTVHYQACLGWLLRHSSWFSNES